MAAWDTIQTKINSARDAMNMVDHIRATYAAAKLIQSGLALYQAGSDPVYNGAVNALLTSAERAEVAQMLVSITALIQDWETNHRAVLGI